jgi:putative ABC transport system substrate-binding protein
MPQMKRRDFITLLGGAAAAWPLAWPLPLSAQQPKRTFRIGILTGRRPETILREALARLGYIEGQNTIYEVRNAQAQMDRLGPYAAELVERKVDVIVAAGGPAAEAVKRATSTIPIVLWGVGAHVDLAARGRGDRMTAADSRRGNQGSAGSGRQRNLAI